LNQRSSRDGSSSLVGSKSITGLGAGTCADVAWGSGLNIRWGRFTTGAVVGAPSDTAVTWTSVLLVKSSMPSEPSSSASSSQVLGCGSVGKGETQARLAGGTIEDNVIGIRQFSFEREPVASGHRILLGLSIVRDRVQIIGVVRRV